MLDRASSSSSGWPRRLQLSRWLAGVSLSRRGTIAAAALIVLVIAGAGLLLWQARQAEIEKARATATNLVQLLHDQTRGVFQTSDLALRNIKARLEHGPPLADNDPSFRVYLRSLAAELPYVRALFVIGPDGFITHDTDYPDTPHVSLADRSYFLAHQRAPNIGVFVGEPLISRSVDRWFVPLARRVDGPDGSFAGVVVAAVEPRIFENTYYRLSLSEDDAIGLFHVNGTLIARAPPIPDRYGKKWADVALFAERLPQSPEGVYTGVTFGGASAVFGYKTVAGFPLVVTTAVDLHAALADWRRLAVLVGFGVLFIAVLLLLLAIISERRRLEMQIAQQRALMAHKLETVGQMTSSVAHDFNNVLAVVSSGVGLMKKRGATEPLLSGIQQAVERGARLTTGLLDFAKRQEFDRRAEDPNRLLRSLEFLIRQSAGKNVDVSIELNEGIGTCLISRSQFDAAIINLVLNASDAMPHGGAIHIASGRVAIDAGNDLAPGAYARIRITDTGSGMSQETLDRVFEPFFTTKEEQGGTGLGLPQVRNFVRAAGGDVQIVSEVGKGTQIDLLFPCEAASAS